MLTNLDSKALDFSNYLAQLLHFMDEETESLGGLAKFTGVNMKL